VVLCAVAEEMGSAMRDAASKTNLRFIGALSFPCRWSLWLQPVYDLHPYEPNVRAEVVCAGFLCNRRRGAECKRNRLTFGRIVGCARFR
jgi:hypothetical protein